MKIRCRWLAIFVLCTLLLHWFGNFVIHFVIQRRLSLFVQFLDMVGIPSTVHMPDMSCSGCNSFDSSYTVDVPAGVDCSADNKIFLLVLVLSQTENFNRRNTVRQTWGSVGEHKGRSIRTYFICGRSSNVTVETQLAKEIAYWGDMVQVDMSDNYLALSNKTLAALQWAIGRCGNNFNFLMKTDDDSFNVPQFFVDYLVTVERQQTFVGGLCASGEEPNRNGWHKWYVPFAAYPGSVYPLHLKGRAYVISSSAALRIISVSTDVIFNAMEDVYITGVCRAVARIPCTCIPGIPRVPQTVSDCEFTLGHVKNMHPVLTADRMKQLWALANNKTAPETCSVPTKGERSIFVLVALSFIILILLFSYRFTVINRDKLKSRALMMLVTV